MHTIIHMRNVPGKPKIRALDAPLPCMNFDGTPGEVPIDFHWDGSSVPWLFRGLFPRHRHPVASGRHDWRCLNAKNAAERLFADKRFQIDVGKTSWWVTKKFGYWGARLGAFFGMGSDF